MWTKTFSIQSCVDRHLPYVKRASLVVHMVRNLQWGRPMFHPWVRQIPWRRKWQPTPVFLSGEFRGQRSLAGYSSWYCKESDMTGWLTHTVRIQKIVPSNPFSCFFILSLEYFSSHIYSWTWLRLKPHLLHILHLQVDSLPLHPLVGIYMLVCCVSSFSHVQLFVIPWAVVSKAPLSIGIFQAGILKWAVMPSSRGSSQPRDRT